MCLIATGFKLKACFFGSEFEDKVFLFLAQVSDPGYVSFTISGLRVRALRNWLVSTSRIGWFSFFSLPFYPTKPTTKSRRTQNIKQTKSEKISSNIF